LNVFSKVLYFAQVLKQKVAGIYCKIPAELDTTALGVNQYLFHF